MRCRVIEKRHSTPDVTTTTRSQSRCHACLKRSTLCSDAPYDAILVLYKVTDSAQRVERALTAFVRQEFGAPIATIMGLTEILIEDARCSQDEPLASDLDRIHSAGRLLQEQLDRLVSLATKGGLGVGDDSAAFRTALRHDLRTPLNAVKGYSELILEEARDNGREDLLADVGKLLAAAEQLLGRVDALAGLAGNTTATAEGVAPFVEMPSRD